MAATLLKKAPVGAHTAGIYADMTVDGPEIGTLVVIIDRAKNLPNRKSMGKQDPYCAARLGKEAKKTETDKRGGQTPRWDQELRFTVHDSPDYYRLKVSVFNDDKRTDLIGECWLPLEEIIVRGGGQNDHWHSLNFKGRYAGEIRIELTYYDIRPPESKTEDRKATPSTNGLQSGRNDALAGPRQPKPLGRRPLPSNPTEPVRRETNPLDHKSSDQVDFLRQSLDFHHAYTPSQDGVPHYQEDALEAAGAPCADRFNPNFAADDTDDMSINATSPAHYRYQPYQRQAPELGPQPSRERLHEHPVDHLEAVASKSDVSSFLPAADSRRFHSVLRPEPLRPGSSSRPQHDLLLPGAVAQEYDVSQGSCDETFALDQGSWPETHAQHDDIFNPPPPPPVHRASNPQIRPEQIYHEPSCYAPDAPQHYSPSRSLRSSISGSPLAQVQYAEPQNLATSASPLASEQGRSYRGNPTSQSNTPQSQHRATHPPGRDRGMTTPASLIAGHNPRANISPNSRPQAAEPPMSKQIRHTPSPQTRHESSPTAQTYARTSHMARDMFPVQDNRGHRHSAPPLNHNQSSPATELPKRKPVHPDPNSFERRSFNVPFSPDSFDAFNPGVAIAQTEGNNTRPRYSTPEQAMEAAAQHDRETKRGDEPIIGSDGRVIDPSDHLPADTWAPEPESKKRPEITVRIKPRIPLAEARPNAVSMPNIHTETPRSQAGRARLQKKTMLGADYHSNSSPAVPTMDMHTGRAHAPRHYASDYKIRERENYDYSSGSPSPTYARSPAERAPPPLPAKVPLERERNYWEGDALSEELRGIDIGVGPGARGSARRRGYGF